MAEVRETTVVGITGIELAESVYKKLTETLPGKIVTFTKSVETEIADDSDWHRNNKGYMGYDSVFVAEVAGKKWLIGLGRACGGYPKDRFSCDIFLYQFNGDERPEQIIPRKTYFVSSVMIVMSDGNISGDKNNKHFEKLVKELEPIFPGFIAKDAEYRDDIRLFNGEPVIKSPALYKIELVDKITEIVLSLMAESTEKFSAVK